LLNQRKKLSKKEKLKLCDLRS